MNWFLVILFMNPAIQAYDVADGWYPLPYATETICQMKLDFMSMYVADGVAVVDCVEAPDMWAAIKEVRKNANE